MEGMTSLADAIAPSPAPAPAATSAPAPAPEPVSQTPPQPPVAGTVNPYLPPAAPPQNLQTPPQETPAPAALDPGQPPQAPAQTQDAQPQAPQIPPEYMQAHEWRAQIEREAEAFGGLDMVPQALKWGRMLFGLEAPPEGVEPANHFLNELWRVDRQTYREVLSAAANEHADRLLEHLEDRFFAKNEIPKDRLPEIKDFLRYGRVATTDSAQREFVQQLRPEFQTIFPRLSEATRNWLVDQVDRGIMTLDFAEEQIRKENILLAIEDRDAQAKQRETEAAKLETDRRSRQVANENVLRYQNAFVEAYSRKHQIAPEDVLEKVAYVAGTLDEAAGKDVRHPARVAWDNLLKAAESGNEIRIKAAMGQMQVAFEAAFDAYMARRSGKSAALAPAPAQPPNPSQPTTPRQGQQPQFEPDKPNAGEDWSKVSLQDYLFGRANPNGA